MADPEPIHAGITFRIHEGELVMAISDGEGHVTLHRQDGAAPVENDAAKGGEVPGDEPGGGSAPGKPDLLRGEVEPEDVEADRERAADDDPEAEQDHGHPKT